MSITVHEMEVISHDRTGGGYGHVNIIYRYDNKQSYPRLGQCEEIEVTWADEGVYGPPALGNKVGDSMQTWLIDFWDCGVFTHREITQRFMDTSAGPKLKELAWFENPREKILKNGKPRMRRAKWLSDWEVDLVCLYFDRCLDTRSPSPTEVNFLTVTRMDV